MVRAKPYDVLWLDKVLVLEPDTLAQVRRIQPRILIIGYSPDNMVERHNQSLQFLRSLPLYDLYFTTKFNKVDELRALGCPRVVFTDTSFNPALHRPIPLTPDEKRTLGGPVGFVGTAEKERAISVAFLADQGVPVRVWGNEWPRWKDRLHARFEVCGPSQMGDMYVRLLNAFDINLGFLRKANFDQQTCRSMEIPACGKFMLAERTEEHRRLFEEGKEAEFFASDHELLEKARYYTAHVTERERIAAAGLARVWKDGYCYQDRLAKMLDHVAALMQK